MPCPLHRLLEELLDGVLSVLSFEAQSLVVGCLEVHPVRLDCVDCFFPLGFAVVDEVFEPCDLLEEVEERGRPRLGADPLLRQTVVLPDRFVDPEITAQQLIPLNMLPLQTSTKLDS